MTSLNRSVKLSRRSVLAGAGASLALLAGCQSQEGLGEVIADAGTLQLDQIGIQTYTLREAMAENFVGTFEMIKSVGYDYVELNGRDLSDRTAAELRALLDDIGLPSPACHAGYDELANDPARTADNMAALGSDYAILPWIGDDQRGLDDYKRHADMLNRASETMKSNRVRTAYHNHQFEFFDLGGGVTGMDILLSETDPDLVDFELDLFWAHLAGVSIPDLFAAHPGRFKLSHVKDMKGDPTAYRTSLDFGAIVSEHMANVGEGEMDFAELFSLKEVSGMQYFIVEHDNPPRPFRQSIQIAHDTMRALRF